MKYALIENNIVKVISYQLTEGFVEVADNVFADMVKKEDGTFDYSNEFKTNQQEINTEIENRSDASIGSSPSSFATGANIN